MTTDALDRSLKVSAMLNALVDHMRPRYNPPSVAEVAAYLERHCFPGAGKYAAAFCFRMEKQGWRDKSGKPLRSWQRVAKAYAGRAEMGRRKIK